MASSETERADEEAAGSSKPAAVTDEVDGGWGSVAPKAVGATADNVSAEQKPAAGDAKPVDAPPPAPPPPLPQRPPASEATTPPVEAAPPPDESEAARVELPKTPDEPEPPRVETAKGPEPAPPPVEDAPSPPPANARGEATRAPALPPPLPVTLEAEAPRPPLFGEPPTKGWFFVGGGGMLLALFVGILVGRLTSSPARTPVPPAPAPRAATPPVVQPPAPAPADTVSAPVSQPKPAGAPAVKHSVVPFNAQAAKLAIDRIVPKLKGCKQPGEPPGTATVTVTFAPTGRVSNAAVTTTRYAGTRTGSCIAQRLREARVPEFTGAPVTVKRGVAVR